MGQLIPRAVYKVLRGFLLVSTKLNSLVDHLLISPVTSAWSKPHDPKTRLARCSPLWLTACS